MNLSIGIVGLPNVGKSTLFKLLTKQEVNIANYPFATIDPNVGIVPVPDERVNALARLSESEKKIPAVVEFYDIAGLVKGANKGEGLGNQFLARIRECGAIIHLVRCFKSEDIIHVEGTANPLRDIDIINTELLFKDIDTVTKRLVKAESDARGGNKEMAAARDELTALKAELEKGIPLFIQSGCDRRAVKELGLLTAKKQIFLLNGSADDVTPEIVDKIKAMNSEYIVADLALERTTPDLIKKAYAVLNLISFFTTGEDETRAWTITAGTKAPQAAGVIHTDFENKFIRAEVVSYEKLVEAGAWNKAREKGWMRLEGREYAVKDGDVIVVRHG